MEENKESYTEAKLSGMFEAYQLIETAIVRLRRSLDNVWMVYDQADSLDQFSQESMERLSFAMNTLFVLRQMFEDEFDMSVSEIKSGIRDYENEDELR